MSFAPIRKNLDKRELIKPIEYEKIREVWNLVPKAEKVVDADGVQQDVVRFVPVKVQEIDIQKYIDSFADEVGIQNILKKVALTGDKSYLNQTGREPLVESGQEPVQDYTNVPQSKTVAFNAVAEGVRAYDSLPAEIKGKMSFAQFAEGFGQADFDSYIQKVKEAYTPKEESK